MLEIREIMEPDVVSVDPQLTLRELVELLNEYNVSGAPVVANDRVVGVISSSDILQFQEDSPGVPVSRAEDDISTHEEMGVAEEWEEGTTAPSLYFSQLWTPTEADVLERIRTTDAPEWDVLDEFTVSDVMTPSVFSMRSDRSVQEAAEYMLEVDVHRLLVIDDGVLKGIVTTTDVVRAVAEGRLHD